MFLIIFVGSAFFSLIFNSVQNIAQADEPPKPKISWSGDIRVRLAKAKEDIDEARTYQQLRARLGLRAEVNDQTQAIIRLATGSSSISTNQTLGDSSDPGMQRRSFGLDLAYIDWQMHEWSNLWFGRVANPFWSAGKSQLIFDSDLSFEGAAAIFKIKKSNSSVFLNFGSFIISENSSAPDDLNDTSMLGGDIGYAKHTEHLQWTIHFGNYYFNGVKDKPITRLEKAAKTDPYSYPFDSYRGNSVYPNDPLLPADQRIYYFRNGYILLQLGTELKYKWAKSDVMAFAEVIKNDTATNKNRAIEYGFQYTYKSFYFGVAQIDKQADSVLGAFTDSDTNGGGTDNKGRRFLLGAKTGERTTLQITQYKAQRGVDTVERDYSGTQLDLVAQF